MAIGFQQDDLPLFGQIKDIMVLVGTPIFGVKVYTTMGINNHLSCFCVVCAYQHSLIPVSKLVCSDTYSIHQSLGDDNMYIAMRSHVVHVS